MISIQTCRDTKDLSNRLGYLLWGTWLGTARGSWPGTARGSWVPPHLATLVIPGYQGYPRPGVPGYRTRLCWPYPDTYPGTFRVDTLLSKPNPTFGRYTLYAIKPTTRYCGGKKNAPSSDCASHGISSRKRSPRQQKRSAATIRKPKHAKNTNTLKKRKEKKTRKHKK